VPWYWIADPRKRIFDELELVDGAYVRRSSLEGDAVFEPAIFPGLSISLDEVWPNLQEGTPEE